jgi:hypothetical protein
MSETVTNVMRRVCQLPYSFTGKSNVACEWEHDIMINLVVCEPWLFRELKNISPLRFCFRAF